MDSLQVIFLSIVQGITEFLPISSSAHLILPSQLLGWQDQGLVFDVAVHFGTLLAVLIYFRKKLMAMTCGFMTQFSGGGINKDAELAWQIIIATVPAVIAGFLVNYYLGDDLRQLWIIAAATIVFGVLLWFSDNKAGNITRITFKMALIIGLWQCLALIPGTSRSGITMTAALMLGLSRSASAEFSFLLSIPLILAASLLKAYEVSSMFDEIAWGTLLMAIVCSFLSALACIHWFLGFIEKIGFKPFVIYRFLLGGFLLFFLWS